MSEGGAKRTCYYGARMGFFSFLVRRAGGVVPLSTPFGCLSATVLVLVGAVCLLAPLTDSASAALSVLHLPQGVMIVHSAQRAIAAAALVCVGLFQARCLMLCYPNRFAPAQGGWGGGKRRRSVATIAGLAMSQDDLCTSVLVTGVTGSSKTAGVLLPLLAQLFSAYDGRQREKVGAFIPEVKGDLVDAAIYLARRAGRDVARDVIILSPSSRIPVVRYRDDEGRQWFLSARGGSGGSEAGEYFPAVRPRSGGTPLAPPGPEALEDTEACEEALPQWREDRIDLQGRRPGFVGWRWERGGLRRFHPAEAFGDDPTVRSVAAGLSPSQQGKLRAPAGQKSAAKCVRPPRQLRIEAIEFIDSGVHYNLIDPRLPPAEVAERLTRVAAMARGGGTHRGENDYFYEQGRKLLAACLTLLRASGGPAPTLIDILRCATQNDVLEPLLESLDDRHRDLAAYFRGEWLRMVAEGKTATVIRSTLSAAFDVFLHDPALAETFCRPSTFSFADVAQHGKIIGFVPGDRYEQLGRALGTACKMDFQSAMLSRTSRSHLNATRLALYVADECHKYAAAGSATAGDPYFMNLSRSNRVMNLCATQSYAWLVEVLGRDAANVYIAAFGVQFWLQQTDPETCRRAAEICGQISRERVAIEHDLNFGGMVEALHAARPLAFRRRRHEEESARFRPEEFALLDVGEVVGYNKGLPGRAAKARRGRVRYLNCTRPPRGAREVNAAVRDYYRDLLEIRAAQTGHHDQWDAQSLS